MEALDLHDRIRTLRRLVQATAVHAQHQQLLEIRDLVLDADVALSDAAALAGEERHQRACAASLLGGGRAHGAAE